MNDDQLSNAALSGLSFGMVLCIFVFFAFFLVVSIFYYMLLQKTMNRVSEANRPFPGGLVWLGFIPAVGPIWVIVYAILLSLAIKKDFIAAGRPDHNDGALPFSIGQAVCLGLTIIPILGAVAAIVYLVLWIMYWVKIAALKDKMPVRPLVSQTSPSYPPVV